jgi:hypothetical protein
VEKQRPAYLLHIGTWMKRQACKRGRTVHAWPSIFYLFQNIHSNLSFIAPMKARVSDKGT